MSGDGINWTEARRLSSTPADQPEITVWGHFVTGRYMSVGWRDIPSALSYCSYNVFVQTWYGPYPIVSLPDTIRSCLFYVQDADHMYAVWTQDSGGVSVLRRTFYLSGVWSPDSTVSSPLAVASLPSMLVGSSYETQVGYFVWTDRRDGNAEVYFKYDSLPQLPQSVDEPGALRHLSRPVVHLGSDPSGRTAILHYMLPTDCRVAITIRDATGRMTRRLVSEYQSAGRHCMIWDGCDGTGCQVARGCYFCTLEAGGESASQKVVLAG